MSFIEISKLKEKEIVPGFKGRFVHSENMTFAHWSITAGSSLPMHSHPNEQVAMLISGTFELTIEGKTKRFGPGSTAIIPSNASHTGKAITDCYIIDAFYPIREDYK